MTGTLYRGCAIIDHPTRSLAPEMAMLATDGQLGWLGPAEEAPDRDPGPTWSSYYLDGPDGDSSPRSPPTRSTGRSRRSTPAEPR